MLMVNGLDSIYAVLSAYLFACSLVLTAKAFGVSETCNIVETSHSFRVAVHQSLHSADIR